MSPLLLLLFLIAGNDIAAKTTVPDEAIEVARAHLEDARAKGSVPEDVRLGEAYVVLAMSPRRTLDFLRSDSADPTPFITHTHEVRVLMVRADSCFSSIVLYRENDTFHALGRLEYTADRIDLAVHDLRRSPATHRVWVFASPWPMPCQSVVVERADGKRLAFTQDIFYPFSEEGQVVETGESIEVWGAALKTHLRSFFGVDQPLRSVSHDVPSLVVKIAEESVDNVSVKDQITRWKVKGPVRLGEPMIQYWLRPIEELLYAESNEVDPTVFDPNPSYSFPAIVDGKTVAIIHVTRSFKRCPVGLLSDSTMTYQLGGIGLPSPEQPYVFPPPHLAGLGDVAIVALQDVDRWFHVIGSDSTWMSYYYPPGSKHPPQPISEIAKSAKERIRAKLLEQE